MPSRASAAKELRYEDLTIDQAIDLLTKAKAKRGGLLAALGADVHDKKLARWVATVSLREVAELGGPVVNPQPRS